MYPYVIRIAFGNCRKPLYDHIKAVPGTIPGGKEGIPCFRMAAHVTVMTLGVLRQRPNQCGNAGTNDIVSRVICRVSLHV